MGIEMERYRSMARIRAFEREVERAVKEGAMPGTSHLSLGQEAVAVGVCEALGSDDVVITTYRGHGQLLARGGAALPMMAEVFGRPGGLAGGRLGSLHLSDPSLRVINSNALVGATPPIALGAAFAQAYLKKEAIAVAFLGDGATDRGTFHEAMNLAALWELPLVLVVENNGVAYFTVQERHQKVRDIAVRADAYGAVGIIVDGNDVDAVVAAAREARALCLKGKGPVLLECKTYRQCGHFVGDACAYRPEGESERWASENDPLSRYRAKLVANGRATTDALDAIEKQVRDEMRACAEAARRDPAPAISPDGIPCVSEGDCQ